MRLAAADTFARLYLALGRTEQCEEALQLIETNIHNHPELAAVYHVRWGAIPRARLLMKQRQFDKAIQWLSAAQVKARQLADVPLDAIAYAILSQMWAKKDDLEAASACLLSADRLGITTIPNLQAQYYYISALILRDSANPLEHHLRDRAIRLWAHQGTASVRLEIDDGECLRTTESSTEERHRCSTSDGSIECITDSLAALTDLACRPRLLATK
jgi:tetratricopeptide (TPR) repeat protein